MKKILSIFNHWWNANQNCIKNFFIPDKIPIIIKTKKNADEDVWKK